MVREWGMSDAIGPMAWGSQGQVFLGEDLMHTRDYSEDTSKIIDDEVERILRVEEQRAMEVLSKHRGGLNAIARALLDNEIIDGAEVARLVDEAHGSPVHDEGAKSVPHFNEAAITAPAGQRRQRPAATANGHGARADAAAPDGTTVRRRCRRRPGRPGTPLGAGQPDARDVASPAVAPAGQPRGRRPGGTRGPLGAPHSVAAIEPNPGRAAS